MKRKILVNVLCFILLFNSFTVPVNANEDYLSISLADIIVTFYNASGVAIGDTELFNAIYQLYGNVTLGQLADAGIIYSDNPAIDTPSKVKDMLGYGNLTAPIMKVSQRRLQALLGDLPTNSVATDALRAMFDSDIGTPFNNVVYHGIAGLVGMVAEIGKIGYGYYEKIRDWVTDPSDPLLINHSPFSTLRQAYQKFTDSTYFQDLVHPSGSGGSVPDPGDDGHYGYYLLNEFPDSFRWGFYRFDNGTSIYDFKLLYSDAYTGFLCFKYNSLYYIYVVNPDSRSKGYANEDFAISKNAFAINNGNPFMPSVRGAKNIYSEIGGNLDLWGGYRTFYIGELESIPSDSEVKTLFMNLLTNGPTITPSPVEPEGNGVTNYINNQVGNIASDNYINLSPNIGTNEYINIFDRIAYIENLNQIENNTNNGDYSQNSTVINNYNNQYIQNTIPTARPSTAPAQNPDEQPAQPFVSPRPTQTPEFVESVVQEGGLSSEITTKFPFCIPWDIKALIDNLWAPEARAPYIHWDAEFGSWGKLGEVDIDLSEYDDVARIFRSTTLLLWIVGLIVLTRNLIG